jgi:hypothetical protein
MEGFKILKKGEYILWLKRLRLFVILGSSLNFLFIFHFSNGEQRCGM